MCRVVRNKIDDKWIYFTVQDPRDTIQREHIKGAFYEPDELQIIKKYLPENARFCDIGANIGNHSLYVLKYLGAAEAILFEPNPTAIAVLQSNMALNGVLDRCDMSHLGFGLSDKDQGGFSVDAPDRNLGGARLVEGDGDLRVRTGDAMLKDRPVDFIKIDVEGMEIGVLKGLSEVVRTNRPVIFIEVDNENADAFKDWVTANDYEVKERFQRYEANENFLLVAK